MSKKFTVLSLCMALLAFSMLVGCAGLQGSSSNNNSGGGNPGGAGNAGGGTGGSGGTTNPPTSNLTVSSSSLSFSFNGSAVADQTVAVGATGAALSFTVTTSGEPWLKVTPASGTTPANVTVSIVTAGLKAGTFGSTITITTPGSGSQTVAVSLTAAPPTLNSVNHVLVMLQENRSFDSYFGKLNDFFALKAFPQAGEVDGIPASGFINSGIKSYHSGSVCMENLSPDWAEDHHQVNLGNPRSINGTIPSTMPMNGFVNTAAGIANYYSFQDTAGRRAMGYYTERELNYYYALAGNFAINDKFYSPAPTNTTNNRLYAFGATSQGTIHTPGGAEACPGAPAQMRGKPIFQLLDEAGISWKIYITDLTPRCDPKNGSFPLQCALFSTYLEFYGWTNPTNPNKPDLSSHLAPVDCTGGLPVDPVHPTYRCPKDSKGKPVTDYFTDVKSGTLPAVAFIETGSFSGRDEHPSGRDLGSSKVLCNGVTGQTCINIVYGVRHLVQPVVDALMNSPSWSDSVFFWAFDEGGGAYDHGKPLAVPNPDGVKPYLCSTSATGVSVTKDLNVGGDFNITGFRVPNIVVSPFTKKNYVSHVPMDYTAILTFIEARWNLPNLNKRDAFWKDSQGNPLILDMFDFGANAWATPPASCDASPTDPHCIPVPHTATPCAFSLQ